MNIKPIGLEDIWLFVKYRMAYLSELNISTKVKSENIGSRNATPKGQVDYTQKELYNYFKEAIEQEAIFAFMAELEGEVVSFGAMVVKKIPGDFSHPVYLEGDILNMYTVPSQREKGFSALILKRLIDEAKNRGISKIALHTTKAGEKIYKNQGFQEPIYPVLELPL